MNLLERIWEFLGLFFSSLLRGFERAITSVFGSQNARYIKRLQGKVDAINSLEPKYEAMSDEELREQTTKFRQRLAQGETLDDLLVEAFAVCREAGRRYLSMRHFDVQLIGGMVLHSGSIAEMVTGEGKTLVATLPAYLNALEGKGRPRRDGQRLPGSTRHGMDGTALHGLGADRRSDPKRHGGRRAAEGLRLRYHVRHEQRVWLRLSARQHASGGPRGPSLSRASISSRRDGCISRSSTKSTTS